MNNSAPKFLKFARECVYRRLQFRYLALHLLLFRIRLERLAMRFAFKFTIFTLQVRNAVIVHVHGNYPFLFWF